MRNRKTLADKLSRNPTAKGRRATAARGTLSKEKVAKAVLDTLVEDAPARQIVLRD